MASCDLLLRVSFLSPYAEQGVPNTAEAHESYATGRFGASLVDLVENVSAVDEVGVAGERNGCERLRRCFWPFW